MIPREQFEKMSVLALVAILLLAVLSIQAFAMDDGLEEETGYQDSGILPGYLGETFLENVSAIRQDLDILLYFIIPVATSICFVYLLGKWFYSTFIGSVL